MENDFFKPDGDGDPATFQHIFWFFGHPSVWITIALWMVILAAGLKLAKRLWKRRKTNWLIAFLIIAAAALSYYVWLSINAHSVYVEGASEGLPSLRRAKRVVLGLGIFSVGWIVFDWIKALRLRHQSPK